MGGSIDDNENSNNIDFNSNNNIINNFNNFDTDELHLSLMNKIMIAINQM